MMKKRARISSSGRTYVIRSFLSFSFFRPPNAILVPGMYFLGFSRYSNYTEVRSVRQILIHWFFCPLGEGSPPGAAHTRVSSFHSIPFCLLASVYA